MLECNQISRDACDSFKPPRFARIAYIINKITCLFPGYTVNALCSRVELCFIYNPSKNIFSYVQMNCPHSQAMEYKLSS